jgi:hypothetical protein
MWDRKGLRPRLELNCGDRCRGARRRDIVVGAGQELHFLGRSPISGRHLPIDIQDACASSRALTLPDGSVRRVNPEDRQRDWMPGGVRHEQPIGGKEGAIRIGLKGGLGSTDVEYGAARLRAVVTAPDEGGAHSNEAGSPPKGPQDPHGLSTAGRKGPTGPL